MAADSDSQPWRDADRLEQVHLVEEKSPYEIADEWECSPKTIYRWLDRHEIDLDRRGDGNPDPWNAPDSTPWRDAETLRAEYVENGHGCKALARKWDCNAQTIYEWLLEHGIQPRKSYHDRVPHFWTDARGYERVKSQTDQVKIHRLAAVAWFGWDAVADQDIHHKNDCPFDNRESNLRPIGHADHSVHHDALGVFSE